jgi:hypothetical protein
MSWPSDGWPPAAGELQTGQADGGSVARGRTVRRWFGAIPHKLPDIAHPTDGHPVPGVADIHVPHDIGRRQRLARAPLMGNREIVFCDRAMKLRRKSGLGLGSTCGQSDTGQRDAARQECCGNDPLRGVAGVRGEFPLLVRQFASR